MGKYLEQIVDIGYATETFEFLGGKATYTLRSISADIQLEVEHYMKSVDGGTAIVLHTYSIELLARLLEKYNNVAADDVDKNRLLLGNQPTSLIDSLVEKWQEFEKLVAKEVTGEEIENTFFETASTSSDSEQKPTE
jgi:hypothetical protein